MDEKNLEQALSQELIEGWEIIPTGSGFMVATDWHWPNRQRIEIYVRAVGEREDLYIITDGGEILSSLFAQGIDLSKDEKGMRFLNRVAENYGAKIVDYQMVKGANPEELPRGIRLLLEAIKDASLLLWHKMENPESLH